MCIWLVARDLIAAAPDWQAATGITAYGWWALGFALASIVTYFLALMCTHLAAFRCASNMRKATTEHLMSLPLGYFSAHPSGELRRVIDGCASSTETLLAHMLPDVSGAVAMVVGMLVMFFVFDWRLGAACLLAVAVSIACLMRMMSGDGMKFMRQYMGALARMNATGTEYVRGIPVVKVFQQTVFSFQGVPRRHRRATRSMAMDYAGTFCRAPQVAQLTALNGLVVFLLPVAILLAPGEGDFAAFLANFAFYAIFSAIVPTAMAKLQFAGEASQMSADSLARVKGLLEAPSLPVAAEPRHPSGNAVAFRDVSFAYEGAERPALDHVSFDGSRREPRWLWSVPRAAAKSTAASLVPRFWDAGRGKRRRGWRRRAPDGPARAHGPGGLRVPVQPAVHARRWPTTSVPRAPTPRDDEVLRRPLRRPVRRHRGQAPPGHPYHAWCRRGIPLRRRGASAWRSPAPF